MQSVTSTTETLSIDSPVGKFALTFEQGTLVRIVPTRGASSKKSSSLSATELEEYFSGKRKTFTLPLGAKGTPFQEAVWKAASKIPYGKTVTYKDIARQIGKPAAVRAVGTALGANPIPIIIPCHRVVPSSGGIGQYAFGSRMKKQLLELEGAC